MMCGSFFFFFNDTATTEIYTLSLHDALPISGPFGPILKGVWQSMQPVMFMMYSPRFSNARLRSAASASTVRSEEHTSELQSRQYLVCRLLLEKKNQTDKYTTFAMSHARSVSR